jgi:hypothetical protein
MSVLHLIHWITEVNPTAAELKIAAVSVGDYIVLARRSSATPPAYEFKNYAVEQPVLKYSARTSINTILSNADELTGLIVENINNLITDMSSLRVYNPSTLNVRTATPEFLLKLTEIFPNADTSNLETLIAALPDSASFPIYDINGNQLDAPPLPKTTPVVNVDLTLFDRTVTSDEVVSLIQDIDPDMKYEGFSPAKVRHAFLSRSTDPNNMNRDLQVCFMAYAHIGNNVSKLNTKRINLTTTKKVLSVVGAMGVAKKAGAANILTLPRLAISFMPQYVIFRKFLSLGLQHQTMSTIDVMYQDIVFSGCDTIRNMPGYSQFHIEFSGLIANGGKGVDYSKDENQKEYKRWNKISINGYASDTTIHADMTSAINSQTLTRTQASSLIKSQIIAYKILHAANPP